MLMTTRPRAVLTEDNVREIKYQLLLGTKPKSLAARFGISVAQISQIKSGKRWKNVD